MKRGKPARLLSVIDHAKALIGTRIAQYFPEYGEGEKHPTEGKFGLGVFEGKIDKIKLDEAMNLRHPSFRKIWLHVKYEDNDAGFLFIEAVAGLSRTAKKNADQQWTFEPVILSDKEQDAKVVNAVVKKAEILSMVLDKSTGDIVRQFTRLLHVMEELMVFGGFQEPAPWKTFQEADLCRDMARDFSVQRHSGLGTVPHGSQYANVLPAPVERAKHKQAESDGERQSAKHAAKEAVKCESNVKTRRKQDIPLEQNHDLTDANPIKRRRREKCSAADVEPCENIYMNPIGEDISAEDAFPSGEGESGIAQLSAWLYFVDRSGQIIYHRELPSTEKQRSRVQGISYAKKQCDGNWVVWDCEKRHNGDLLLPRDDGTKYRIKNCDVKIEHLAVPEDLSHRFSWLQGRSQPDMLSGVDPDENGSLENESDAKTGSRVAGQGVQPSSSDQHHDKSTRSPVDSTSPNIAHNARKGAVCEEEAQASCRDHEISLPDQDTTRSPEFAKPLQVMGNEERSHDKILQTNAPARNAKDMTEDIVIESREEFEVSLLCPISRKLIQCPSKGKLCSHIDCFDMDVFMDYVHGIRLGWCESVRAKRLDLMKGPISRILGTNENNVVVVPVDKSDHQISVDPKAATKSYGRIIAENPNCYYLLVRIVVNFDSVDIAKASVRNWRSQHTSFEVMNHRDDQEYYVRESVEEALVMELRTLRENMQPAFPYLTNDKCYMKFNLRDCIANLTLFLPFEAVACPICPLRVNKLQRMGAFELLLQKLTKDERERHDAALINRDYTLLALISTEESEVNRQLKKARRTPRSSAVSQIRSTQVVTNKSEHGIGISGLPSVPKTSLNYVSVKVKVEPNSNFSNNTVESGVSVHMIYPDKNPIAVLGKFNDTNAQGMPFRESMVDEGLAASSVIGQDGVESEGTAARTDEQLTSTAEKRTEPLKAKEGVTGGSITSKSAFGASSGGLGSVYRRAPAYNTQKLVAITESSPQLDEIDARTRHDVHFGRVTRVHRHGDKVPFGFIAPLETSQHEIFFNVHGMKQRPAAWDSKVTWEALEALRGQQVSYQLVPAHIRPKAVNVELVARKPDSEREASCDNLGLSKQNPATNPSRTTLNVLSSCQQMSKDSESIVLNAEVVQSIPPLKSGTVDPAVHRSQESCSPTTNSHLTSSSLSIVHVDGGQISTNGSAAEGKELEPQCMETSTAQCAGLSENVDKRKVQSGMNQIGTGTWWTLLQGGVYLCRVGLLPLDPCGTAQSVGATACASCARPNGNFNLLHTVDASKLDCMVVQISRLEWFVAQPVDGCVKAGLIPVVDLLTENNLVGIGTATDGTAIHPLRVDVAVTEQLSTERTLIFLAEGGAMWKKVRAAAAAAKANGGCGPSPDLAGGSRRGLKQRLLVAVVSSDMT